MKNLPIRFHWSLSQAGSNLRASKNCEELTGLINFEDQLELCLKAEENGIDSMLMAIGFTRPDPLMLTIALAQETKHIKFLIAVRSGLITPTYFVQQLNTATTLIGDRIHINVVNGHTPKELKYYGDFLDKEQRNLRTSEFVEICNAFWTKKEPVNYSGSYYQIKNGVIKTPYNSEKSRPEIYVGGNSKEAADLVSKKGDCLWRFPDAPEALASKIQPVLNAGKEVGILTSIVSRPTEEEAKGAAKEFLKNFIGNKKEVHKGYKNRFDSQGFTEIMDMAFNNDSSWITPYLWTGAVPYMGAPSIALVGSYENIAKALYNYKKIGITQFLFIGWPDIEEIEHFGQGVLPLVRKMEKQEKLKPQNF
ncbi:LLM class flavin-dependent oxidoreductase [Aquimarina sp. 2201CG14-23]|uniref:LLM class flavin-dependent oxidoreductase n=1 Tax=Aquimarina mycalae TaxID=3040073 RepID=UPI002477CD0C|nr:LLM class flavin-dependent oxidoreductase [Aquimarina sp. 2201CG14-23]MDH7448108.1 LLM class flavin-dependent oxidoreductase [Aquimarina sp. 2201CG14-23]